MTIRSTFPIGPAIIEDEIFVAVFSKAQLDQFVSSPFHKVFVDFALECIPEISTHLRNLTKPIIVGISQLSQHGDL